MQISKKVSLVNVGFAVLWVLLVFAGGFWAGRVYPEGTVFEAGIFNRRTLDKYAIAALRQREVPAGTIQIATTEASESVATSTFAFQFDPALDGEPKISTGQLRLPVADGQYPLVVMLRGYVDQSIYQTGVGSQSASAYLAENGYVTVAPDFLGYGGSDTQADDIFEARFQTYTLVLALLSTLESGTLPPEVANKWDGENIFVWAHSNGGQIALTILEVTNRTLPTVLWAPVSKPFPYSVLYYTDESQDGGRFIRRGLAQFEERYNSDLYSLSAYLDHIDSPILLQQGTADDAIPVAWSESLYNRLRNADKDIYLLLYEGADHNLRPAWDEAIIAAEDFFAKHSR